MISKKDKKVSYHIDEEDDLKYIIENYNMARPFSSFFPGMAGIMGIPMWCFYVNRGQGICSFGVENKDGAIMEFQPANKAYRYVSTHGFRTFIKYRSNGTEGFYEPFQQNQANLSFDLKNKMIISPYDLSIEEENATLGIIVKLNYFTVPGEPIAALVRTVSITNTNPHDMELELLDGMPVINYYGMSDFVMKNMSKTIEAWAYVENLENQIPFYKHKYSSSDSADVVEIKAGNFYCAFQENQQGTILLKNIIDPALVFGHMDDLAYPYTFNSVDFNPDVKQNYTNRTCCAMAYVSLKVGVNQTETIYSMVGNASDLKAVNSIGKKFLNSEFFTRKASENRKTVRDVMDKGFVNSSSREFNSYCRQNFLDNCLRGGIPLSMGTEANRDVVYVYSRKHGDLERDYNAFCLMPTYFSQGNGAYRDINQNRRNDIWFNPDTGYSNIVYFINLIQLDGFNPLSIKGVSYLYNHTASNEVLKTLVEENSVAGILDFLKKPFIPHSLITYINNNQIALKVPIVEFITNMILNSKKLEEAEHGEGYWTDHWHYNLDSLESYEALYPERIEKLISEERLFSFYEDEYYVLPRKEKYILHNGRPRQLGSIVKDKEKLKLIKSRGAIEANRMRTEYGKGQIYRTSLLVKLICLCANKVASLDANGTGIEMEAGKPNWNDAINGLPSFFGSSVSETFELKRLTLVLQDWIGRFNLSHKKLNMPLELEAYLIKLYAALKINEEDSSDEGNFNYWDIANSLKEAFREQTKYGISGKESAVDIELICGFLTAAMSKIDKGIKKAYNEKLRIFNTYFMNEPNEFEVLNGLDEGQKKYVRIKSFKQVPLAPFLEGQVHAMRVERNAERARELYKAVLGTELYDAELGMFKVNASLKEYPMELGRIRAFTPGWLENESVFMHMEYKYLLEIIKSGLVDEFYRDSKTAFPPYMKPKIYGRSIFENSSFIASTVNPDERVRGGGFVARLSGTTAEFYNMLLVMALGNRPFYLNGNGELELELKPLLPGWMFTEAQTKASIYINGDEKEVDLEENTYCFRILGDALLVYHNAKRLNTYGENGVKIERISIVKCDGTKIELDGSIIPAPYAEEVRKGIYSRIDTVLA